MGTMIQSTNDVVSFLKGQHQQVKRLFEKVLSAAGKDREEAFYTLRRMLAVHETAEEEIVHPAARRALVNGDAVVSARLLEENEAKRALSELEKLDANSPEFEAKFRKLQSDVIAHAESEEKQEFAVLKDALEPARLERMRRAAEFAESVAPTRPHAGVESATANLLAGPFASMLDRTRDALSGKA
ncbi:MAG TPA: hemerythrin domain-containing protein [Polyangiaceae bacterium]|jgi:hemerythrin superfamily protein|nr:hemerythrin domain-containing protein [Polyangiaceae bacterium]